MVIILLRFRDALRLEIGFTLEHMRHDVFFAARPTEKVDYGKTCRKGNDECLDEHFCNVIALFLGGFLLWEVHPNEDGNYEREDGSGGKLILKYKRNSSHLFDK